MKKMVIREGRSDFSAYKIAAAALASGGDVVSVTVSPVQVWDPAIGQSIVSPDDKRMRWIVWATFDESFYVGAYDQAIEAENKA